MKEAVIVSTARTPIGRAFKGALNNTHGALMAGHAIHHAVKRAGIEGDEVEDVIMGCGWPEGETGKNIARLGALSAGLPVSAAGLTVNRFCGSGLQAIAQAAHAVVMDDVPVMVAGGVESISLVNRKAQSDRLVEAGLKANHPDIYLTMIETAEIVAKRYGIDRDAMDAYSVESQRRTAEAQKAGRYDQEIVPITAEKLVKNKEDDSVTFETVTLSMDEGNRPGTSLESLSGLNPVLEGGLITAGNASQLSDAASACVVMSAERAAQKGLEPMGIFRGLAVAGLRPDEMGIGPVHAVPRLLERHGLKVSDIGIWELNEAFAVQTLYCRDKLGIDPEIFNVDGGAISIGHPFGMSGARMVGHLLIEGRRRGVKYGVATMCIAGGIGLAGLFEIC